MTAEIASMDALHVEFIARLLPEPGPALARFDLARIKAEAVRPKPREWGTALAALMKVIMACAAFTGTDRRNLRMIGQGYFFGVTLQDRLTEEEVSLLVEPWSRHAAVWVKYPRRGC